MPAQTALPIDVFSDVVCPWCFIGKRRLENAIALKPDIPVEVRFHPFFLNPWIPREGISRDEYLTTKFGSPDRYAQIAQRVAATAKSEGLVYNVGGLKRQPNTLDCHRLILWASRAGSAACVKQRLMDLYFTEGGDLTERETLVKAATDCGLDADEIRGLLASETDVALVSEAAEQAQKAGIQGVPFFIVGGLIALSGAQPAEQIAAAIEQASNEATARQPVVAT